MMDHLFLLRYMFNLKETKLILFLQPNMKHQKNPLTIIWSTLSPQTYRNLLQTKAT